MTYILLFAVPMIGLVAVGPLARALRHRWLPDADAITAATLAAVFVMAAFLASFHAIAFAGMMGLAASLSVPAISIGFLALLALTAAIVLPGRSAESPIAGGSIPSTRRPWTCRGWTAALCLIPVILTHLFLITEALSRVPTGYDGLKYHLPVVVTWLREDALVIRPDLWEYALPANAEIAMWWLLKAGAEHLASAVYFPAGLLLVGAVWTLVRAQRGSRFAGFVAVATVLSTQMVVWQMYNSHVDLFGTAFLATGLAALLLAAGRDRERAARRRLILIAGLAIGIALGTKPVNWGYGFVATILFVGVHLWRNRRRHDLAALTPIFLAACLTCSAFWFVRAAMHTGNPFYPVRVAIGDRVILPGVDIGWTGIPPVYVMLRTWEGTLRFIRELPIYAATLNAYSGGVGPLYTIFVPLGCLIAAAGIAIRRRRALRHDRLVVLLLTVALFLVWVLAIRRFARFGMIYLALATCLAAPGVGWIARHWPRTLHAAALAAACLACAMVSARPYASLRHRITAGDMSRSGYYAIPPIIDELPPASRIINLTRRGGRGLTYPLYGEGLENDVLDAMTTERMFPDLKPTISQLRELGIEYVFMREPFPDDWDGLRRLSLIYDDGNDPQRPAGRPAARLYRVPSEAPHAPPDSVALGSDRR